MMRYRTRFAIPFLVLSFLGGPPAGAAAAAVEVREERIVLPTYEVGPAEPNPIFYSGRAYQGAKGPIYPYALLDKLSDVKRDKTYRILYLENEFVRVGVLPEIGGRIFEAVDKTNGYDFIYRQHVIKPALIGMLGAWISGGAEWNIPHHHRASTFMRVDSGFERQPDGSATVWVGEIELRQRTKWIVGLTLRPGSSALEVTTKIFNRTPLAHSILCFANVAVHANENYQVLFPPTTRVATFHGKNQFSEWPVSHQIFNGQDYTPGVDVSWWKNHLTPTSFFAFEADEDFLAGYDHGRRAGIAFIGDHHVVPGKKLWTWGTGSEGKTWEKILTDDDGPYLELMVGSYSDNQPDYSWTQPSEAKIVTQYWYPIRSLGALKNANREAACSLEIMAGGRALVAFNSTSARRNVRVLLRSGERVVYEDAFDIGPGKPYEREVELSPGTMADGLSLGLYDADGAELVRYAPEAAIGERLPPPVTPPPPPKEMKTSEELYLAGLRLEQFYNPVLEATPYYEEALRRDPSDARANTALGILHLKRGMCIEAEKYLRTAINRLTVGYTRPKDGESLYYLGLALRRQAKNAAAEDAFQRAGWSAAWQGPSFHQLAEMASTSGDFRKALEFIDRALAVNGLNLKALNLKSALLRRLGRPAEALEVVRAVRRVDPLDFWSLHELYLAEVAVGDSSAALETSATMNALLGDSVPALLEMALDYGNGGLWAEAAAVLGPRVLSGSGAVHPLLAYAFSYALDRSGRGDEALKYLKTAAGLPPQGVFPFELEFADILEWAGRANPSDGRAFHYLGNLLFDLQPERAVAAWERSRSLEPAFPTTHRNLGLAYARVKDDLPAAVTSLERAVALNPRDARLLYELDVLSEAAGVEAASRLAVLEKHRTVVAASDNALAREVALLVQLQRFDRAIDVLRGHHFHVWEGGGEIHGVKMAAHLGRGRVRLEAGKSREALEDFLAALTYPENLEVPAPSRGAGSSQASYLIGLANEALGYRRQAEEAFMASASRDSGWSEETYFRGLALEKLGRGGEAERLFVGLMTFARDRIGSAPAVDFFEKFGEKRSARLEQARYHYLAGLGLLGKKEGDEAAAEFEKALALDPNLNGARRMLAEGKKSQRK